MNRKKISEKQLEKLPARVLLKNKIGKGGTGSGRVDELIVFAFGIGAEIGITVTGKKIKISGCPDSIRPVLDGFWRSVHGDVEKGEYIMGDA